MTPELANFLERFGLPLVGLVALAYVYYRSQKDLVQDLRTQRDTANARSDSLIESMRAQTAATSELTTIVREGFKSR